MVDATKAMESSYINADLVRESPTKRAVIIDGGGYVMGEYQGKTYEKLELTVEIDKKMKKYAPNRDSVKNISSAYGADTEAWVGNVVKLQLAKLNGKDSIIAIPVSPK